MIWDVHSISFWIGFDAAASAATKHRQKIACHGRKTHDPDIRYIWLRVEEDEGSLLQANPNPPLAFTRAALIVPAISPS